MTIRKAVFSVCAVLLLTGTALSQDVPYREGTVWNLTFVRTKAGMGDDYLRSLSGTWKKVMDQAKKDGLIVSYKVLSTSASNRDDFDLILMTEHKNMASLDGLDARMRAIEGKIVGNEDQQRSLMVKRFDVREILGEKLARELIFK
jgi:hypothetical protein